MLHRTHSTLFPAAVMSRRILADNRRQVHLHADGTPKSPTEMIAEVNAAVQELRGEQAERIDALERAYDSHATILAGQRLNGGAGRFDAEDPQYTSLFAAYVRQGGSEADLRTANATGERQMVHAALTEGSTTDGGYLTPTEWDRRISQSLVGLSPIRRLSSVRQTKVGAYSTLWKLTGPGTGWVGETASRPATATPTFASIIFGHGEIYANAYATQRILDDSSLDLAQWLTTEIDTEIAKQEAIAFLSGDGVNKPFGMLLYATGGTHANVHPAGAIAVAPSGSASGLTVDGLIDFTYGLAAPYRQNASWLMSSQTAAAIAKMKDSDGNLIWRESLIVGQPSTLLGRPVELDENMPTVAAGNMPVVFGDFKAGYLINDRQGSKLLRDPYTNKPYVGFYVTKRVGGGVQDPNALRILKIAAS